MNKINLYKPSKNFNDFTHICVTSDTGYSLISVFGVYDFDNKDENKIINFIENLTEAVLSIISIKIIKSNKDKIKYNYDKDVNLLVKDFLNVINKELTNDEINIIVKKVIESINSKLN